MKFNVQNFLEADKTKADEIWYIKDDDELIRKVSNDDFSFTVQAYHRVLWWAYIKSNGKLVLLMYIENPRKKYDYNVLLKRRRYFFEVYESLEKGV